MEIKDLKENPIWATKDELNKQRLIENAYKKMRKGSPLTSEEDDSLKEYYKLMKDLSKTKSSVDANKGLIDSEQAKHSSVIKNMFSNEGEETGFDKFYNMNKEAELKIEEEKIANFNKSPDYSEAMMASLMKDTPGGVYQNAQARMLAENELVKSNYIKSFNALKNESKNTFDHLMKNDPELSHPDVAEDSKKYYSILSDYSPALAKNPVVLKTFIMKARSYGGIDPKELTSLIQTNNEYMKHISSM